MDNFLNMYHQFQDRQNHPSAPQGISSSNHSPGGAGSLQEDNDIPTNLIQHQRTQKGGEESRRVHPYYGSGAAMMGEEEREGGFHPGGGQTTKMMVGGGGMQERWGPPGGMFGEGGGGGGYGGGGASNDFIPPREWRRGEQGQARSPKGKHHQHGIDKDKNGLKKKAALTSKCCVCGAAAAEHVHYGAICCYSCRAFFRRSGARNYQCIRGDNLCEVNTKFRKYCKKCRYKKCIDSGMKPELVDASRRNKEADIKALQGDTVPMNPIKEEQTMVDEDITAPVSPDRAVSSSIKTETPNRDDEDVMMMQRQGSYYPCEDGGSSSSGSNYAGSPRRSPYGGYNPGLQNHFMATMIDKMSFMSQREGLKQQQRMLERIARSSAEQQEYNIVNTGRHLEERPGPGTSGSSTLESVPGHVPAQALGPGQVNKELIQQLVEEQYHRLQQQQQEKQPPALICTSSSTAQRNDQEEQPGLTTPPGARSGSPEYGSGGWTRQEPRGIDGWQQEELRNLAVQQQDHQVQVSTIRANPHIQQTVKNRMEGQGIEDEKMDQDLDEPEDCESGLCSAFNDQTGPEYRDISRLFNISNLMDLSNGNSVIANDSSQRISVIQEGPRITSEEEMKVPLKKRTCTKMCQSYVRKFLYAEPIMALTFEEKRFIDKRVLETRQLVKMVQPQQQIKTENPVEGLTNGRIESLNSFRANFKNIFGVLRSRNIIEIDKLGLLESRFLVCAMTSIGTRMFGNGRDKTMLEQKHEETYTRLMRSPWACSFEGEEKVQCTLESVGRTIGGDEKLEVLFTTCIMRGYQDPRATFMQMESGNRHVNKPGDQPPAADLYDEPGHPSRYKSENARCGCEDPNLLTGGQFSLLMWRYLRDSKDKKEAAEVFKRLEGLIKPLYECQNIFYYDRLPC